MNDMAEQPAPAGHNLTEIKRTAAERIRAMVALQEERSEITAKITELRQGMVADGMNRAAVNAAVAYYKASDEQKEGFDTSYEILREAIGQPVQPGLFGNEQGDTEGS